MKSYKIVEMTKKNDELHKFLQNFQKFVGISYTCLHLVPLFLNA
jgi:hypothetical protein